MGLILGSPICENYHNGFEKRRTSTENASIVRGFIASTTTTPDTPTVSERQDLVQEVPRPKSIPLLAQSFSYIPTCPHAKTGKVGQKKQSSLMKWGGGSTNPNKPVNPFFAVAFFQGLSGLFILYWCAQLLNNWVLGVWVLVFVVKALWQL